MAENLVLNIELEYDPVKNSELGNITSKLRPGHAGEDPEILEDPITSSIEGGSDTGRTSYLSLTPTTIQSVHPNQTLFVWRAAFHPSIGRRFQSAIVSFKFSATQSSQSHLEIVDHAPRRSFGGVTRESRKTSWGLELPLMINVGGVVGPGIGITPTLGRDSSKEVEHAFTITGTRRGRPYKTSCIWTLEENASSERGLPSEVQFAVLLNHTSPVQCDISVSARTAGGMLPPHFLKARTSPENSRKIIDPSKYFGLLHEYALSQDRPNFESLLASWTGDVEGSILAFGQPCVKP
ncbi:hypothetical protein TWF718_000377 [Orbilia javanica]|uniref:Uncharacterized protein n=1 Tax=Orbilia javanica TaxID=47235 RepID=A0AAN8NC61_9PEZI